MTTHRLVRGQTEWRSWSDGSLSHRYYIDCPDSLTNGREIMAPGQILFLSMTAILVFTCFVAWVIY